MAITINNRLLTINTHRGSCCHVQLRTFQRILIKHNMRIINHVKEGDSKWAFSWNLVNNGKALEEELKEILPSTCLLLSLKSYVNQVEQTWNHPV